MAKLATPIAAVNVKGVEVPEQRLHPAEYIALGCRMPMSFGTSPMMTRIVSPMTFR